MKNKSIKMTLPKTKELHGIKIVKLPVARYINALDTLENLPSVLIKLVLPEMGGLSEILKQFQTGNFDIIEKIIIQLLKTVPREFCKLLLQT